LPSLPPPPSILVLTLAVFASASFNPKVLLPFAEHAGEFAMGFLHGSQLNTLSNIDECLDAITKAGELVVPLIEKLKNHEDSEVSDSKTEIERTLASTMETCYEAISSTYAAILAAKQKKNENYGAYIYNYLTNYQTFIADGSAMTKALSAKDFFSAGEIYGTMFHTATGFNVSEIEPILASGEAQYDTMIQGSGNVTGIPVFLQNATLFFEGFGSGFDISDDTNEIVSAEQNAWALVGDFQTLAHDIAHGGNILGDINNIWVDFTAAFQDATSGANNLMEVFAPAIQAAKTNSSALENAFKSNLASHPLQSAVLAAKLKLEWSADNWYAAGSSWGGLCQIGLKGYYNVTSAN